MGDLAAKVTAQLGGGASEGTETEYPEKLTEGYYRVRTFAMFHATLNENDYQIHLNGL